MTDCPISPQGFQARDQLRPVVLRPGGLVLVQRLGTRTGGQHRVTLQVRGLRPGRPSRPACSPPECRPHHLYDRLRDNRLRHDSRDRPSHLTGHLFYVM